MPNTRLTQAAVERTAPPKSGRITLWDNLLPSFGLRLTAAGSRSWVVCYRHGGKKVWYTLGTQARMPSVEVARRAAREALAAVASGGNPAAEKRVEATRSAAATVAAAVGEYLRHCERSLKAKTVANYRQLFAHDILPAWGDRELTSIGKRDVLELIDRKAAHRERKRKGLNTGASVQAAKLLTRLGTFFAWAIARDLVSSDPTRGIQKPAKDGRRDRVLTDDETISFWNACETMGAPFGHLFKLLLVTAQRENEVAGLRWSELDIERQTWTIPSERAKNKKPHMVHLSKLALEILGQVPRFSDQDLVFSTNGRRPVSGFSKAKNKLDGLMDNPPAFVLHDLRRTATTGMARIGIAPHVADKVLNHVGGTIHGVARIYNQFQYLDERKTALESWSRFLENMVRPSISNVVAIR